jgi:hypothetical protein
MIISLTLLIPCKYYIIYNIFIFFVLWKFYRLL